MEERREDQNVQRPKQAFCQNAQWQQVDGTAPALCPVGPQLVLQPQLESMTVGPVPPPTPYRSLPLPPEAYPKLLAGGKNILSLPEPGGAVTTFERVVRFPTGYYENAYARVMGPRCVNLRQLEETSGCTVRCYSGYKESSRRRPQHSGGRSSENEAYVSIRCKDTEERAAIRINYVMNAISSVLRAIPVGGRDRLKEQQIKELAIMRGTYRCLSPSREWLEREPWLKVISQSPLPPIDAETLVTSFPRGVPPPQPPRPFVFTDFYQTVTGN